LLVSQTLLEDDRIHVIPRSREVGQSWASTFFSTLIATWFSVVVVWTERPRLLLLNGPGTCVPVALAVWVGRILGVLNTRVVFIESVCRVESLSLTGRLMFWGLADRVLVQWEELTELFPGTEYVGIVM
jgi:beta-1,4-N-acetylglucosaminyltransferase